MRDETNKVVVEEESSEFYQHETDFFRNVLIEFGFG